MVTRVGAPLKGISLIPITVEFRWIILYAEMETPQIEHWLTGDEISLPRNGTYGSQSRTWISSTTNLLRSSHTEGRERTWFEHVANRRILKLLYSSSVFYRVASACCCCGRYEWLVVTCDDSLSLVEWLPESILERNQVSFPELLLPHKTFQGPPIVPRTWLSVNSSSSGLKGCLPHTSTIVEAEF